MISCMYMYIVQYTVCLCNKDYRRPEEHAAVIIDNSLPWKEDIIMVLQQSLSMDLTKQSVISRHPKLRKYKIHINPYRIDEQGFEGTVLNIGHLYQAFVLFIFGVSLSILAFLFEFKWKVLCNRKFIIKYFIRRSR